MAVAPSGLEQGMNLARQGKFQDAVKILRPLPPSASNFYYQGYCYFQLKHKDEAKTLFKYVVENYPKSQEAQLANDFLKKIDPSYVAAPLAVASPAVDGKESGSKVAESKHSVPVKTMTAAEFLAMAKAHSLPEDMSKLPDEARLFFVPDERSGHMIVDATINGHPYKCMFDTGAPGLLFGKNHLRAMGLPLPQGPATTRVSGWAGVYLPAWEMNLKVKVGNVERTLPAVVQEEFDMAPLIGYSFIEGYQYEIDQKAKCMMLRKEQKTNQALNSLYDVPCQVVGTKPIVPLEVNGRKINVFIDTGAAMTIINGSEAVANRIEIPSDAPTFMAGGVGGASPYKGVNLDLKLGPIVRKDFQVMIGGHAGSCVGQDFLQGWRFTVDEHKGLMRFFH